MEELQKSAANLESQVAKALSKLRIKSLTDQLDELETVSRQPDFWSDHNNASNVMQEMARIKSRVEPWHKINSELSDLLGLIEIGDQKLRTELEQQLAKIEQDFGTLKEELKLNGPYDDHDAILSLSAGAGGTDAQDWTQMLFRMYVRWAEKHNLKISTIEETAGDEAGLKNAVLEISGKFVYGKLRGEHGVHRLVRLSPYNADHLRQTSFAKVEVMPKIAKPEDLLIDERDLKVDVYRSGGHGGQSVNTTDSAVRITHLPTGVVVAIQNERSQLQNKEMAMTVLRSRLAQLQLEQHQQNLAELKGPNQSAEWGNQIRSYVLHPYKQVKDLRSKYETSNVDEVLDGDLDNVIDAFLEYSLSSK
jgi:peptide chain release factor 2